MGGASWPFIWSPRTPPTILSGGPHDHSPGAINELVLRPTCCLAGMPGPERGRGPPKGIISYLKLNHAKL